MCFGEVGTVFYILGRFRRQQRNIASIQEWTNIERLRMGHFLLPFSMYGERYFLGGEMLGMGSLRLLPCRHPTQYENGRRRYSTDLQR